ncbi:hypothetical protein C8J57DRAFT_1132865, partial [Mycena rebaudengoi]
MNFETTRVLEPGPPVPKVSQLPLLDHFGPFAAPNKFSVPVNGCGRTLHIRWKPGVFPLSKSLLGASSTRINEHITTICRSTLLACSGDASSPCFSYAFRSMTMPNICGLFCGYDVASFCTILSSGL